MTTEVRVLQPDEGDVWYGKLERAFSEEETDEERAAWRGLMEPGRSLAAWDDGEIVGTAGAFSFGVTVPGGASVPAAGVTMVSVQPTHRRRGVLTAMMRRQLDDVRERGEPLAILTASESAIYGRFGYGAATQEMRIKADTTRVAPSALPGCDDVRLRLKEPDEVLAACEAVYARTVAGRAGMLVRPPGWDRLMILDPEDDRDDDETPLQCVVAETGGEVTGYARYSVVMDWAEAGAQGTVQVRELAAPDPVVGAALWRYLFGIDLTAWLTAQNLPVDDPLLHLVPDMRRCLIGLREAAFVRPVELGAALAARTYQVPVDTVLQVADPFCPWNEGRWRLSADRTGAVCERTTDPAELALSVRELGSAYLGGFTLSAMAGAGRVRELRPGALAAASVAFGVDVAPWLPHEF
ncbi:GNAT family N-acetyltransferase [Streptomyces catenulae]|uniref:GNAT family N-acetyltransferase n=1 Tax=Streptomyces catenulae TaxID=66875 RepID=A0ABV2YY65_9ACTN|nr:GNAT family N-acetyltransferase [Streptomyces catenulae]